LSKVEKLIEKLKSRPKDFTWSELQKVLGHFGYEEKAGQGSRRKFISADGKVISLHEPHPRKIVKLYMIEQIVEHLRLREDE
jgi:predicted RNA binding protein YcfA (HicA-like mRNA interferase family)